MVQILRDFVNLKLVPYLHGFKQKASGPNTIEYKIGEIFGEIKNKISSGYNLREILDRIDELKFRSQTEKHELSHLYEAKIRNMGNAGRNGGEYYTPRPLIRAMIQVVQPKIGEQIYDGACGSAGFLCESFDFLKAKNADHFTHVKAEKIAHMVEARLGIDLGRAPLKDAAGPNDFPHLKKVEHRARMTRCFDFKQVVGAAYHIEKLGGFDRLVARTRAALGDRAADVDDLLQWMLPMKVQQAEIVATVFAAWNNLLLDGQRPGDEQIVCEARENWHPDKLKIDRQKFVKAVQWLREQGVVPEGKGKRVIAKGCHS